MDLSKYRSKLIGSEDERAVSPVIGVILMVAITVILAAVIAAFVLDMGDSMGDTDPQAAVTVDGDETDTAKVTVDSLGSSTDGVAVVDSNGEVINTLTTPGESVEVTDVDDYEIRPYVGDNPTDVGDMEKSVIESEFSVWTKVTFEHDTSADGDPANWEEFEGEVTVEGDNVETDTVVSPTALEPDKTYTFTATEEDGDTIQNSDRTISGNTDTVQLS